MGIVTHGTRSLINRVAAVCLLKGLLFALMTSQAQGIFRFRQKVLFFRGVRVVAGPAAFGLGCPMDDFLLVVFPLMALIADLAAFFL